MVSSAEEVDPNRPNPLRHLLVQTTDVLQGSFAFVAALAVNDLVRSYVHDSTQGKWAYAILALSVSIIVSLALKYLRYEYEKKRAPKPVPEPQRRNLKDLSL